MFPISKFFYSCVSDISSRKDAPGIECNSCGAVFRDIFEAVSEHATCRTWSCRYLHNENAITTPSLSCRLCPLLDDLACSRHSNGSGGAEPCQPLAAAHRNEPNFHKFRDCDQALYTSVDDFVKHLRDEHNAWFPKSLPDFGPWQRIQVLEIPSAD